MKTVLTIMIAMAGLQARAASLSDLTFMAGCWSLVDGSTRISENWTKVSSNLMQGIAQTKVAGAVQEYQFLRIERRSNGLIAYTPYINGTQMPDFFLEEKGKDQADLHQAVFINEKNEFPKKISYSRSRSDDSQIFVQLEGLGENGKNQVIEFPLFKTDCNEVF